MKNFVSMIDCIMEPSLCCNENREFVQITMHCRINNRDFSTQRVESTDFLVSHFDLVFNHMRDSIKHKFLEEVQEY